MALVDGDALSSANTVLVDGGEGAPADVDALSSANTVHHDPALGPDSLREEVEGIRPGSDRLAREKMRAALAGQMFGAKLDPVRLGRFTILERLGEGGMGVVYSAYDPQLDRRVALKLLRSSGEPNRPRARERLLREAKALAQLSHPNVVPVHDVGVLDDQVFIVMEFVVGQTLRDWARAATRSWRDVVDLYQQAGNGLAAAHAAGLVHRDFKPESRSPPPEHPQPADRSLSHGFGCSGGGGLPFAAP